ncbi:glycoside hydrolase family 5 protein, partial [Planctomycetota bacterium]
SRSARSSLSRGGASDSIDGVPRTCAIEQHGTVKAMALSTAILTLGSLSLLFPSVGYPAGGNTSGRLMPPPAKLVLDLKRGICIDRQFQAIPPDPRMRIAREDIRSIKSMGFGFVKLIVNPEPLMSGSRLDTSGKRYLAEVVDRVVDEGLPVVVCIHPRWQFKKAVFSDPDEFSRFIEFLGDMGRFLAAGWGPKKLVFQLMTEPGRNAMDWNDLLPRMWQVARRAMPEHTLILAGDKSGQIEGLLRTKPVNDSNVVYSFTFYEPFVLTFQGGRWRTPKWWSHLGSVPYPSSPRIAADRMPRILERIPADPAGWRPAVKRVLTDYGNARWNREKIAARIKELADWDRSYGGGLEIWCAEFGCYQRTIAPADRYRYIKDVREAFEENGIGWAYWSYNETFTVLNPVSRRPFTPPGADTDGIVDADLLDALGLGRTKVRGRDPRQPGR